MHKQHRLKRIMKLITTIEVVFCVIMIVSVFCTRYYTMKGIELSQKYMKYTDIANELNKSSDNLTEEVRLFAETGNPKYMDGYRVEADASKYRKEAIENTKDALPPDIAFARIEKSIKYSEDLVYIERYAIKLTALGYGIPEHMWPEDVKSITLNPVDDALPAEEKKAAARKLVFNENYTRLKRNIELGINQSLNNMIENSENEFLSITKRIKQFTNLLWFTILSVAALLLVMNIFQFKFVVNPIVCASKTMRDGCKIRMPDFLKEMDYLGQSYNNLYSENEKLVSRLRAMAETDALTKLGNRSAYVDFGELLQSDGAEVLLFAFDVDGLRIINNSKGHAAGDEYLCSAADCILSVFGDDKRQNCFRIGGDEFVAFICGEPEDAGAKYIEKFKEAQKKYGVMVSVGYAYTKNANGTVLSDLFKRADKMMYAEKALLKNKE